MLELITLADGTAAPRLAQTRPDPARLASYWEQLTHAMAVMAGMGVTHGDLSAYNLLAADDRLVIIDVPQAVDIVANPQGLNFLARDCRNACAWFRSRGWDRDPDQLLAELVAQAW